MLVYRKSDGMLLGIGRPADILAAHGLKPEQVDIVQDERRERQALAAVLAPPEAKPVFPSLEQRVSDLEEAVALMHMEVSKLAPASPSAGI